jgi:nicotinate-nucleotide pyrophosphorylase (carboxylating)
VRIHEKPFVYLDKNYVRILGGVRKAVRTVVPLGRTTVVQIRGETGPVEEEAIEAVQSGAEVIMVDTGQWEDLTRVGRALKSKEMRSQVQLAFGGNISLEEIKSLAEMDVDVVDVGYAILDAPCLPMRFDVIAA